jgi:predicted nucleic acid-binding protein
MTGFLVDTNVLSEFNRRGQPDPQVKACLDADRLPLRPASSPLAKSDWESSSSLRASGGTQQKHWLEHDLHVWFDGRLLTVDEAIMNQWALLMVRRQLQGRPLDILDGFLAATAHCHDLAVATRNAKDFADLGVEVLNPWEVV